MTRAHRGLAWCRHRSRWTIAVAVAVAYGPLLASSPGLVGADTKTYLYLDPGRLMGQASVLWDADRALGTVTHQNISFLWPMGPFFWFFEALGAPDWVAQRLWVGTLLAAAGLGVRYLLRTLDFEGRGLLIAMLAYELSPYALNYSARISAVLLPWAGLGWLIGAHGAGRPHRRLATPGAVRSHRRHRGQRQRHQPGTGRPRTGAVARTRGRHRPRYRAAPGAGRRRPHRRVQRERVAVVDRRPGAAGRLQPERPALHREPRGGGGGLDRSRGAARPRVLVLLRQRQAGTMDRAQRRLHPGRMADLRGIRAGGCWRWARPRWCAGAIGATSCCWPRWVL